MKTILRKLICLSLLILPNYGFSQALGYTQATDMDVNGIFIGGTYTKAQVVAKWGTPTKYRSSTSEHSLNEIYDYTDNQFLFNEDGIFNTFVILTSDFVVYTAFSGGIKVGDNISRIQTIGLGTPVLKDNGDYHLSQGDDSLIFKHSNGVITQISFMTSV